MEERLIKKLMTSMKCESCGQNYEVYDIDVLGHREDLWFLRVSCSVCHTQCLVAAIVKESGMPEVVTDLAGTERDESGDGRIGEEDVLAMRDFLKGFDGDFSRLFGQEE